MLYKFKSKAAGELIMFEAAGRRVLEIAGKDAAPQGILTVAQIPAAIAAIEAAIAAEEAASGMPSAEEEDERAERQARQGEPASGDSMALRRRSKPFLDLLRRSLREEADVVWGV